MNSMQHTTSEYVSYKPRSDADSVRFVVCHEMPGSDHIQVFPDIPERWRSTADAIAYFTWVIEEIRVLQTTLSISGAK